MINQDAWLKNFVSDVTDAFGNNIHFIGLQGSNGRGEGTENSDMDMVVIFDELTMNDLKKYKEVISPMPHREKICGFVSGKQELLHWPKSDLFQFYFDTTALVGNIDYLLDFITDNDIKQAILSGLGNIYHMCVHNFVHTKNADLLKAAYKSATFVLRAIYFSRTSVFVKRNADLLPLLSEKESEVLNGYFFTKGAADLTKQEFDNLSETLFNWAKKEIVRYGEVPISRIAFRVK